LKKKIIITTGGTGGHIVPAKIFYDYLTNTNETEIISDVRGDKFFENSNYKKIIFNIYPLKKNFFGYIKFIFLMFYYFLKSIYILKIKEIKLVISMGGYMSVPICFAAKILGIKIFLFEPNFVVGRANRLFLRSCVKIITYSKKIKNLPEIFENKISVINPLVKKEMFIDKFKVDEKNFNILIIGGSQGAKIFDNIFLNDLLKISKEFSIKIFQQTGKENVQNLKDFYSKNKIECEIFSYRKNIYQTMLKCNLAITRAGASTINELVHLSIPFLTIPYPFAKDDHQYYNAKYYVDKDFGWLIREDNIVKNYFYEFYKKNIFKSKNLEQKKINMISFSKNIKWEDNLKLINLIINEH